MAKIQVSPLFESVSGKLCHNNPTYVAVNKKTGKMYSAERHVTNDPNTPLQQSVRNTFAQKSAAAKAWWDANKPSTANANGTDLYQQLKKRYDAQSKFGNIYSYLRSLVQDDLTIRIGGTTVTPPSGGGSQTPSGNGGGSTSGGDDFTPPEMD